MFLLISITVIICFFQSKVDSVPFEYYTFNNIKGEDPSASYDYNNLKSGNPNVKNENNNIQDGSAYSDHNRFATDNSGHKNIPEADNKYNHVNNYIPANKATNNSRKNYIEVTYYFNKNISRNNNAPGAYTIKKNTTKCYNPSNANDNMLNDSRKYKNFNIIRNFKLFLH